LPDILVTAPRLLVQRCDLVAGELAFAPCAELRGSPDYRSDLQLLGSALLVEQTLRGSNALHWAIFASFVPRSLSQYEVVNVDNCQNFGQCGAPELFEWHDDANQPSARYQHQALRRVVNEMLAGASLAWSNQRAELGALAYHAWNRW